MPVADVGPEIALIAGAIVALLLAMMLPQRRLGWCLAPALTALAVAALWALAQAGEARLTFSGTWALDGATLWARLMIVTATALCLILAPCWFKGDRRHGEFYRLNARNRVWLARRNLRWPFSWAYVGSWTLTNIVRLRSDRTGLRQHLAGLVSGYRTSPWYQAPRPKLKWSTHLRMTLAGRPPII